MINSIAFGGERLLNWAVKDLCSFDTDRCYVLSFCGCTREFKTIDEYLLDMPWYNPDNQQYLSHINWALTRIDVIPHP